MRFKLEEWLKGYKPRFVGTSMVTKKNNAGALRANLEKARNVATQIKKSGGVSHLGQCLPVTDPDTGETYPTRKAFCEAHNLTISAFDYSMRVCNGDLTAAIRRLKTPPGERQRRASRGVPEIVNPATGKKCSTWVEIAEVYRIPVSTIYRRRARGRPLSEVLTVGRVKHNIMDHGSVHVADHVKEGKK